MARSRHSDKDIETALICAEQNDWVVKVGGGHAWGKMYCPANDKEYRCGQFCVPGIWSTPRNKAKQIRRVVDNCTTKDSDG